MASQDIVEHETQGLVTMRTVVGGITILLLAVLVASCGSSGSNELRVNLDSEPGSLDPHTAIIAPELSVIRQLSQGLLGFNDDLSLRPLVASVVPSVDNGGISEDGLTYTFKLREDAAWSDGTKLTAEDFEYSLKRLLDPELASRTAGQYFVIKGALDYATSGEADAATRQSLRDAVAVEATDALTLQIELTGPSPTFLQKMAIVPASPVRRDIIDEFGASWTEAANHVGNGPFVMTEWVHQDHITLERNEEYWGTKPKLAKITLRMITDPNTEYAAYLNDELDIARVPFGTEDAVFEDDQLSKETLRVTQMATVGIFFNTNAPPFDNLKVRQAFATAFDRNAWVEEVRNGVGLPATGWLPPAMPGFDAQVGQEYSFDQGRAQELLEEAGFPGGSGLPELTFSYVAAGDQAVIAQFLQDQFGQSLGVTVALEVLDEQSFFSQIVMGGDFQFIALLWSAEYGEPEAFLAPLFMTGQPNNLIGYSDPEFDSFAGQASLELDDEARLGIWQQAHEVLIDDAPVAPFFYFESLFLKKPGVKGLVPTSIDGVLPGDTRFAEVSISD